MSPFNPAQHHRCSIRLPKYDYTQPGAYFVTIVTHARELLFEDGARRRIVEAALQQIPHHCPDVQLDEWIVMPNHVHAIIWIVDDNRRGEARFADKESMSIGTFTVPGTALGLERTAAKRASPLPPGSLGAIVGNFKSITTRRINQLRNTPGQPVWQRNYYEHIIRHDKELNAIRQYILDNPGNWTSDTENPDRLS